MSELDEFRSTILARQAQAEEALVNGDPEPRMKLWSRRDPVSLMGGWGPNKTGWEDLSRTFRWVASRFTKASDFRWDIQVAYASGDLGYTVGYERLNACIDGGPLEALTVRVTHVYRREDGEWKIVHRHGDLAPVDESPPKEASKD
jgi:ketosteroid isomerase-like protein